MFPWVYLHSFVSSSQILQKWQWRKGRETYSFSFIQILIGFHTCSTFTLDYLHKLIAATVTCELLSPGSVFLALNSALPHRLPSPVVFWELYTGYMIVLLQTELITFCPKLLCLVLALCPTTQATNLDISDSPAPSQCRPPTRTKSFK